MDDIPGTCRYETHSCDAFHRLERDARVAAELGQALLIRHEAYVADAEQDRERILGTLQGLESDKRGLETNNADLVEDNRALLDRLEGLNNALSESEAQVKALEATLQSTQEQLRRMTALATRTEVLEKQLVSFELEQASLQEQLATSKADERSMAMRARQAERTIASLQDEFDRIESEARAEKERHREVVARLERRRAVERELEGAATRLKGAAAAKGPGERGGNEVVSHFVKDILQDNANLQLGIVELREMLHNSNEEVTRLRDQLLLHATEDDKQDGGLSPKLKTELGLDTPQSRELHVHHHFHEPSRRDADPSKKPTPLQRRVSRKKKNVSISSVYSTPSSASRFPQTTPGSAAAILSQTSVSIPTRPVQSHQRGMSTVSSVPSSPSRRASSLFDRVFSDTGYDSSRPTSPELSEFGSPAYAPLNKPIFASTSARAQSEPIAHRLGDVSQQLGADMDDDLAQQATGGDWNLPSTGELQPDKDIIEEEEDEHVDDAPPIMQADSHKLVNTGDFFVPARTLRRAASHESLISISGMDIHTLQSRPSQLINSRMLSSAAVAAPSVSFTSSRPVAATMATAALGRVSHLPSGERNTGAASQSQGLLSSMVANKKKEPAVTPAGSSLAGIGRSVGGWVRGNWGFAPAPPTAISPVQQQQQQRRPTKPSDAATRRAAGKANPPLPSSSSKPAAEPANAPPPQQQPRLKVMKSSPALPTVSETGPTSPRRQASAAEVKPRDMFRAPGINQPGAIWGLGSPPPAPSKTSVDPWALDEEALRDGLMGGGSIRGPRS